MESVASYLPATILSYIVDNAYKSDMRAPFKQNFRTCTLFADVSGYTKLCEAMAAKGPKGDEQLAQNLNSYFEQLLRRIASHGGDVVKFAGDALLVLWPPLDEDVGHDVFRIEDNVFRTQKQSY